MKTTLMGQFGCIMNMESINCIFRHLKRYLKGEGKIREYLCQKSKEDYLERMKLSRRGRGRRKDSGKMGVN